MDEGEGVEEGISVNGIVEDIFVAVGCAFCSLQANRTAARKISIDVLIFFELFIDVVPFLFPRFFKQPANYELTEPFSLTPLIDFSIVWKHYTTSHIAIQPDECSKIYSLKT